MRTGYNFRDYTMFSNATAATYGNYNLVTPQYNFSQPSFNMPAYNFTTPMFNFTNGYGYTGGTSSTSSSTTSDEQKAKKEAEARKRRIQEAQEKFARAAEEAKKSTVFQGLTKDEEKVLLEEHAKTHEMRYKLTSGVGMCLGMGAVMSNGGIVSHGINTCKTLGKKSDTTQMFKGESKAIKGAFRGGSGADAKRVEAVKKLWKDNDNLVQEAYYQMHKAERRTHSMLGANKKRFDKNSGVYQKMKKEMEKALTKAMRGQGTDDLVRVTAAMKEVNGINDGWFHRARKWLVGKSNTIKDPEAIYKTLTSGKIPKTEEFKALRSSHANNLKLLRNPKLSLKGAVKASGGKMAIGMSLLCFAFEIPNICKSFKNNKKDGWKQLGQSLLKTAIPGVLSFGGEIGGRLLGAKIGGMIGSVVPGLGTIIGAGLGILLSTLVFNGSAMVAQKIAGDNVVNDIKTKELAKKEGGADEILQTLYEQAQSGELKDEEALRILQKLQVPSEQQAQQQIAIA